MTSGRTSARDAASEATEAVIRRLVEVWNGHDLEAFLNSFHPDYASTQPLFPDRSFRGRDNVRQRWSASFATMADFRADLLALAVDGDTAWTEWHWHGTRPDGSRRDERGVVIYGVRDGVIASGRLYMSTGPDDASRRA
jgi:ketosteroid isomerase-like protein